MKEKLKSHEKNNSRIEVIEKHRKQKSERETCIIWRMRYSTSGATARATSWDRLLIPMLCAITSIVSLGTMLIVKHWKRVFGTWNLEFGIWMQNANPNAHGSSSSHQFPNSLLSNLPLKDVSLGLCIVRVQFATVVRVMRCDSAKGVVCGRETSLLI